MHLIVRLNLLPLLPDAVNFVHQSLRHLLRLRPVVQMTDYNLVEPEGDVTPALLFRSARGLELIWLFCHIYPPRSEETMLQAVKIISRYPRLARSCDGASGSVRVDLSLDVRLGVEGSVLSRKGWHQVTAIVCLLEDK